MESQIVIMRMQSDISNDNHIAKKNNNLVSKIKMRVLFLRWIVWASNTHVYIKKSKFHSISHIEQE